MKNALKFLLPTFLFFGIQALYAQTVFLVNPANKEIATPVSVSSVKVSDWNNACGDLQAALDAAAAIVPSGVQIWVMKGTCLPALDESFRMREGVKIYGHFAGTETSIEQRNLTDKANETVLKGNGKSVLSAEKLSSCSIDGLTITGGIGTRFNVVGSSGGGIFVSETQIWISHCNITDNTASQSGGGLLIYYNSSAIITDCIIQNNTAASSRGGGMYIFRLSHAYIKDCSFDSNYSSSGGAICNDLVNSVNLIRCKFTGNKARNSGGAYFGTGDAGVTMDNCIFTNNSAESSAGGALFFTGAISTLNNCVLTTNHSVTDGGGIYATGAFINLNGCIIENNTSETGTGGVSGPLQLTNCLIFNNRTAGGAIAGVLNSGFLKNSIVWGNNSLDDLGQPKPQINSSATVSNSIIQGGFVGAGNIDADPLFVNASNPAGADNIFGTADDGLRLIACSPGIDAGKNSDNSFYNIDFTGANRFYNTIIDIGPYEYQGDKAEQVLASDQESATHDIASGQKAVFMADGMDCKFVAAIESIGSQPVTGSVTSKIWVDAAQSGQFARRHYEITPADNALSATARITLYVTDAEFSAYNTQSLSSSAFLPLSTDNETVKATRISNIKIEKRSGVSTDGTGQPETYNGSSTIIDPADKDIIWNTADKRWEITFNVTGFSGFFIKTIPVPLPVHWVSVAASLNQENNPVISWKVQESAVASYNVQKSVDAQRFVTLEKLQGLGDGMHEYRFTDTNYFTGQAYYRISQTDLDGTTTLSRIVAIDKINSENATIVYPVPAKNEVFIQVKSQTYPLDQVIVTDLNGKKLKTQALTTGNNKVDISKFTQGLYLLRTSIGEVFKIVKE